MEKKSKKIHGKHESLCHHFTELAETRNKIFISKNKYKLQALPIFVLKIPSISRPGKVNCKSRCFPGRVRTLIKWVKICTSSRQDQAA